jgi:hypothetical protein
MIEIITEKIEMPDLLKRRFQKDCINNKWFVFDTEKKEVRYKGKFEDVSIACHNLNKKHYRVKQNVI